jgi:hypothetical protein
MSRKTKQQKIIADLRKQLITDSAPTTPPAKPVKDATISLLNETSRPVLRTEPKLPKTVDTSHLGQDLTRVGVLVAGAVVLELIFSFLVTHGYLTPWGIT